MSLPSEPPTRHGHGRTVHDHAGGDVPHTHGRGWLASVSVGTALGVSLFIALAGLLVWAWTDSDANTCHNALVGAVDSIQCSTVTFWPDIATAALWAGVAAAALIIIAAAMIRR